MYPPPLRKPFVTKSKMLMDFNFKEEGHTFTPIIQAPLLDISEKRSKDTMEGVPGVLLHEKHDFRNKFQFWALYVRFWVLFVNGCVKNS